MNTLRKQNVVGLTEKELAEIAKPSEAEIERAKVFWRSNAKAEAKDILDATTTK